MKHHVLVNKMLFFEMAGASRRIHNSIQFQFSDPLSKLATSRTTRYRIKKKRRCDMAIGEAGQARDCLVKKLLLEAKRKNFFGKCLTLMEGVKV